MTRSAAPLSRSRNWPSDQLVTTDGQLYTVLEGDVLDVLPTLAAGSCDLCLADPPYSSGGMYRGDRAQGDTTGKYSRAQRSLEVLGDSRDQHQWMVWCGTWLRAVARVMRPGSIVGVFVDWRQLAVLYAAFGLGGLVLRGVAPWHKGTGRPQSGRPRQVCEFIVWGTVGARARAGPWHPGLYEGKISTKKRVIFCQKPVSLMQQLVQWTPAGGVVLDPFAGSGSTGEAALLEGRRAVLIDICPDNILHCRERLAAVGQPPPTRVRKAA